MTICSEHNELSPKHDGVTVQSILHALEGLRFGSVEITVHESRVVQIERKEKLRLDPQRRQE